MAVKIRLKRMGKIRAPFYRVVVVDSRKRRDGRVIEEIGQYHPTENPSVIKIDSERAQYWLSVGAQPSDSVKAQLKVTGDWQKFKGLPGAEGTLKKAEPKPTKLELFNAALANADGAPTGEAVQLKKKKAPAKKAEQAEEAKAEEAKAEEAPAAEAAADEAPAEAAAESTEE